MPAVPKPERRARAAALRDAGAKIASRFLAGQVGTMVRVLTEAEQTGHTEHFAPVRLSAATASGRLLAARVTGSTGASLLAEAA